MAAKIEWSAADYAARDELSRIIDDSGIAYRVIAERMGGYISHVRISYIHNGEKAPVRISEFLGICDVCGADPVETLRRIIRKAQRIEAEQHEASAPAQLPDAMSPTLTFHQVNLAAKQGDTEAEQEAYEELP